MKRVSIVTVNFNHSHVTDELDWADCIRRNEFAIWVIMKATIYQKESVSVGKKSSFNEYYQRN